MRIKTISRSEAEYTRERPTDVIRVKKNLDPDLHPFERAREYTRALNAVKLEKVFAKPFIGDLQGHRDGVYCMAKHPKLLTCLISGACDGEIRVWNLAFRNTVWNVRDAHEGFVRGLSIHWDGETFLSCGNDKKIHMWDLDLSGQTKDSFQSEDRGLTESTKEPVKTWISTHGLNAIDHQRRSSLFATAGTEIIEIWDINKSVPIQKFEWGTDTVSTVRFNYSERDVLASCATDRSIALYDLRDKTPIRKLILQMKSNAICWNPMKPFDFTAANEDHNLYTFDMRRMDEALQVHKGHVSAVLDVDYSPTGREFCSGSFDRTIRIFNVKEQGRSREVYHAKRMQRIFTVKFTPDARFLLTGSDDTNIRLWKANASEQLGVVPRRKQEYLNYAEALKKKYKDAEEISKISQHRHLPKAVFNARRMKWVIKQASKRKLSNKIRHAKKGAIAVKGEKTKPIVKELE